MAETEKTCPFMSPNESNYECLGDECAIWDATRSCCSLRK